jgi:hypothetical protein
MASEESVQALVIGRMTAMFSPPHQCSDPAAALAEYMDYLKPYDASVLDAAWKAVAKRHGKTTWPLPSAILQACDEELSRRQPANRPAGGQGHTKSDDWKRYPDNAARAMESGLGQKALSEGWGRILYDHVHRHGNYEGIKVEQMQAIDREVRRAVAELESGDHWMKENLLKLGRTKLSKEDDLRAKYLRRAE